MNERETVRTLLRRSVPDPRAEDFSDLDEIIHRAERRQRRRRARRVGVAVVAAVIVGAVTVAQLRPSGGNSIAGATPSTHFTPLPPPSGSGGVVIPGPGRDLISLFDPSQDLLPGGQIVSPADAAALVDHPLYLPTDAALPSPEVWVVREIGEDGTPFYEAAARYDASVVLSFGTWTNGRDPMSEYQKMQSDSQWGVGYVTTIAGHPAWVVPAGSPHTVDPSISSVEISIGNQDITFLGRVPVEDLIQYASTLQRV